MSSNHDMNPGDEVPPGTPYSGNNLCHRCSGEGEKEEKPCIYCGGTGLVITIVSG
ncbi:MAG: hypothetical protein H7840_08095 [Alphaproteobacteria bacterium]